MRGPGAQSLERISSVRERVESRASLLLLTLTTYLLNTYLPSFLASTCNFPIHADADVNPHCEQGSLVIFFTNFLALMIKAEVTDQNSNSATLYSLGLIIVNIFFALSIWWNTFATIKAIFSRRHVQVCVYR